MKCVIGCLSAAVLGGVGFVGSVSAAVDVPADPALGTVVAAANFADGITTSADGIVSVRNGGPEAIAPLDTYLAALLGQSTAGAAFVTNTAGRVTSFTYDLAPSAHGTLIVGGTTINVTESQTVTGPDSLRVVVAMSSADGSDFWPTGLTIGGVAMSQGRVDVGSNSLTPTNGLLWDNLPGPISSVSITNALLIDGVVAATSSVLTNQRTLPEMGTAVVWNGAVGAGVDESQMIFNITYVVPEPASLSLLALGGLMLGRRRRA